QMQVRAELNHSLKRGSSYVDKLKVTAALFDREYGTHVSKDVLRITDEASAKAVYLQLGGQMSPEYPQWNNAAAQGKAAAAATPRQAPPTPRTAPERTSAAPSPATRQFASYDVKQQAALTGLQALASGQYTPSEQIAQL